MYTSSLEDNPIQDTVLWAQGSHEQGKRGDGGGGALHQINVDLLSELWAEFQGIL